MASGGNGRHGGMNDNNERKSTTLGLSLGALGVVYGDIGTSPLYAFRECFFGHESVGVSDANVFGVLSLIVWSLIVVISLKYLVLIMRADNDGEGGILALMALVVNTASDGPRRNRLGLVLVGLFGAALLYGDGMITPAISVLSAIEGLGIAAPVFLPYVVPITVAILIALFAIQRHGTQRVGMLFGPLMVVWFAVIAGLGIYHIIRNPVVLEAFNPAHAVAFFVANGWAGFLILGIVFLVVTGGEALYADMGHFGKLPIRVVWFSVVLPALLLNYFGQGALVLRDPSHISNPFYHLASGWMLYPLVALSTAATVVASQAVITGAFSLTMQAVQLGYLPRVSIRHTSESEYGQVYVPLANTVLAICTVALVFGFRTSGNLASAYGVAVTTTMVITTMLAYFAMRNLWNWSVGAAVLTTAALLVVDLSFFAANIVKVPDGGWFPLLIGLGMVTIMTTWRRGREIRGDRITDISMSYDDLFALIDKEKPARVPGTEIHLYSNPVKAPHTLLRNLRYNHVLHEQVVIVTVITAKHPYVRADHRLMIDKPREDFMRIRIHYGFFQTPNVPRALAQCAAEGLKLDAASTTYIVGRETLLATKRPGMAIWRERLFAFLSRNALQAVPFYHIPPDQVLEIGAQIEL